MFAVEEGKKGRREEGKKGRRGELK